jgi:putative alpha-1,2-mannosidase
MPRYANGSLKEQDPASGDGFVEGNAAQYTLFVPQDPGGLFGALGGLTPARDRLDQFFQQLNAGPDSPHAFLGNEPTLDSPWLYNWAGQPYKAEQIVRRAMLSLYADTPGGMPGNDDLGSMSSWWVMSALGLYPAVPGTDVLAVGSPLFRSATVQLAGGKLRIRAPKAAESTPFVRSLKLDGKSYGKSWLRFDRLKHGGTLDFDLRGSANKRFGAITAAPSFAPPKACASR